MQEKPDKLVKSVVRTMKIMELLAESSRPLGVTEISRRADLHKSTVYRLLETMQYLGYISQKPDSGKYSTGLKLFEVGSMVINDLDLRERAKPYLQELMEETGETVHLGILDKREIVYIDKVESFKTIRMHSKIGRRVLPHSTALGKVILAFSPIKILDDIIMSNGLPEKTDKTITEESKFRHELQKIKEQGYGIDEQENEKGIRCIAGPIFDHTGKIIAAFSISGPASRVTSDTLREYQELVCRYSSKISSALGYNDLLKRPCSETSEPK